MFSCCDGAAIFSSSLAKNLKKIKRFVNVWGDYFKISLLFSCKYARLFLNGAIKIVHAVPWPNYPNKNVSRDCRTTVGLMQ